MKRLIPKEKEPEICKKFLAGETQDSLGKEYAVNRLVILKLLHRNGVKGFQWRKHKQYSIDETILEKIDCEWKAYFLGWMYTDGNVDKNYAEATIQITEKDRIILDKFNEIIYDKIKRPLHYYKARKCKITGANTKPSYKFRICNKKICESLVNLGVHPKKSLTLKWIPDIVPEHLMCHFIRGLFEGDGSICGKKGKTRCLSFLGTYHFLTGLKRYLETRLDVQLFLAKNKRIFKLNCWTIEYINKIMDFMQSGATLYLPRKRKRLEQVLNGRGVAITDWKSTSESKRPFVDA